MTYGNVAELVLGAAALGGGLAWLVRTRVRLEALRRHHEIGGAVFLQLGVVFAVLLAFVFSETWTDYNTAANSINQECGSLHGMAMLASVLPAPARASVQQAADAYIRAVVEDEWPLMQQRKRSPLATMLFEQLMTVTAGRELDSPGSQTARGQMLSLLARAHQFRETRLFQMTEAVPGVLWALLVGFTAILIGFLLCFGVEYLWSQVIFTATFAASVTCVLVVVALLDYPFEGALRLSAEDYAQTGKSIELLLRHEDGH